MIRSLLQVDDIVFHRKARLILDRVSISVESGALVGLLGSNGAGKTTLFDVICGLRRQELGQVTFFSSLTRVAYLTQVVTVPDALRLGEMAQLVYGLSAVGEANADAVVRALGANVENKFRMLWGRRANSCSYGEKRWFVLMVILSLDADVFILDEPTAGVDPEYRFYIWKAIALLKGKGKAVLFSTHFVAEVDRQCDRFYFLHEGKAREFSSAAKFMRECNSDSLEEAFVKYVSD